MKLHLGSLIIPLLFFFAYRPVYAAPPTLSDYWQGKAQWKQIRTYTMAETGLPYGFGLGTRMVVIGNTWYLFSRKLTSSNAPYCTPTNGGTMETEVRKSTDGGASWSEPVTVVKAEEGKPWECAGTDGGVFYQQSTNTWHFVFQCLSRDYKWNGCYLQKTGNDPMGLFSETTANPVIKAGGSVDGGTFDFASYDGTNYFFTYHGGLPSNSWRAVAKTNNFVDWTDAGKIFTQKDTQNWHEEWDKSQPWGLFGNASVLFENGYYYAIAEASDMSLECIDGQHWDFGIMRANSITSSNWEQLPAGNPIFFNSHTIERNGKWLGCNIDYANLFHDPSTQKNYLFYNKESFDTSISGIYLYELVSNKQGDLNGDMKVDIFDYNIIVENFGHPYTIFDYNMLVQNFGR